MPRVMDPELSELRLRLGVKEYHHLYIKTYERTRNAGKKRYSGKRYENPADRISALREKYKNGVPSGTIEEMLGLNNGKTTEER